jgi:hypothetical protein
MIIIISDLKIKSLRFYLNEPDNREHLNSIQCSSIIKRLIFRENHLKIIITLGCLFLSIGSVFSQDNTADLAASLIDTLAGRLGTEKIARTELIETLKIRMNGDIYQKKTAGLPIRGVFLFGAKEGGFIVSGMNGEGIVVFDGSTEKNFKVSSVSGGAVAGGSAFWAAGIIYGDINEKSFESSFSGAYVSGTAGKGSGSNAIYVYPSRENQNKPERLITLFYSGSGFSGQAGGITYTFKYLTVNQKKSE